MADNTKQDGIEKGLLFTVSEAAELLHVSDSTLRRWSDIGLVKSYRISLRGDRRFMQDDLLRFLEDYNAYKQEPF